jgi:hypothetical protein
VNYTVTACTASGEVLWTEQVPATCFEVAIGLVSRAKRMAEVHSLLVTRG